MSSCKSCTFCIQSESIVCPSCGKGFCCEEHAVIHRLPRDGSCIPIDIKEDDIKGRHIVASRDINPGEVVFVDRPVVVGPNHEVTPLCITCSEKVTLIFQNVKTSSNIIIIFTPRSNPISSAHHVGTPYVIWKNVPWSMAPTKNVRSSHPSRTYAQSSLMGKSTIKIEQLMDHSDKVIQTDRWKDIDHHILKRLIGYFTQEEIIKVSGILDINAYEIRINIRGLLPISSLLNHGCLPNAKELRTQWHFDCCCSRCVSEGKEFLDHVKCPSCYGFGAPIHNTIPDQWKCTNCSETFGGLDKIHYCEKELQEIIRSDRYNINRYLDVYKVTKNILHPQHELNIKLYRWLMPIYCREETQGLYTLSDLELKKEMIDHLLASINVIIPGLNRQRGKVLFELVDVDYKLLNADCQRGSVQDLVSISKRVREFFKVMQGKLNAFLRLVNCQILKEEYRK
ncbi:SMYD [Lepeophtheirus salmonis]|uniref:SMYD n=1 Tax=Lepeophtheirus salmonis TaxID=72036 RepID=A0A7R8CLK0_LEPSM|nr:SMYD [Lepeophtheirus salmonis]CAF2858144.1 SMYD [Lepeophtheirus salmonis]